MNGGKRLWLMLGVCLAALGLAAGLSAVAAQGGSSPDPSKPHAQAPAVNQPPMVGVQGGAVRAGESLSLAAYATDMESEAFHLSVLLDLRPGQSAPAWLERRAWTADLAAQPILRIPVSPPADAKPGTHSFLVGATDSGGLTSWRRMFLEVLPPAEPMPSAGASPASGGGAVAAGAPKPAAAPKPAFSKASPTASSTADSPSLNLSVSPASMAEGSSGDVVVSATLLGAAMVAGMDVVGELQVSGTATDGTDYTLSGTRSVRIPADSATLTGTRTLRLSALADELRREGDETVMLRVAQVTRGT